MPSDSWRFPGHWSLWASAAGFTAWFLLPKRRQTDHSAVQFNSFLRQPAPAQQQDARNPCQFNSFLRIARSEPDPCVFSTWLNNSSSTSAQPAVPVQQAVSQQEKVPLDRAAVAVLYGTEYGFSREIAERLCAKIKQTDGFWPFLHDMAELPEGHDFSKEQAALLICSTQGDGVPPTEAREFCDWLFAGGAGQLPHLQYGVLALGDKSYAHFCRCGKQLDAAMQAAGAKQIAARVDVNKEDWPVVDAWCEAVVTALPTLGLKPMAEAGGGAGAAAAAGGGAAKPAAKRWGKSRPYYASVAAVEGLCNITSADDKDTVRLELDLGDSGLQYLPGDALGIWPSNPPEAVEELIVLLGADPEEAVPVPSWHYEELAEHAKRGADGTMQLQDALSLCYDLRTPHETQLLGALWEALPAPRAASVDSPLDPRSSSDAASGASSGTGSDGEGGSSDGEAAGPSVSDSAASLTGAADKALEAQRLALRTLLDASPAAQERYWRKRHVVDALRDFSAARLTAAQLLPLLRQLQPRLYSISSSPLEHPTRVQATIAVVRYESLGAQRVGVCSTHAAERLVLGQRLPVYIHKNPDFRLPADPRTPVIMVGPGTGLAPFRSFIVQRRLELWEAGRRDECGHMALYFGCRRSDQDYLYGPQLEGWAAEGLITLHTAFSRQQAAKVYVQQRLAETGDRVWELLQAGAHFYVCGDAGSMASAVEAALLEIIERGQGQGREAAGTYLQQLADSQRYQRDVWFS